MFRSIEFTGSGEQLGDGFDSSTEELKPSALKGRIESNGCLPQYLQDNYRKELLAPTLGKPLVDSYSLEFIQSKETLYDFLVSSNDLMGQAKGNIKGVTLYANGGRKSNFFAKTQMQQDYTYILFEYHVRYRAYTLPSPALSQKAKELWQKHGADKFRKRYGDEFIIGFAHSAEYSALIEISNQIWQGEGCSKTELRGRVAAFLGLPGSNALNTEGNLTNDALMGATAGGGKGDGYKRSQLSTLYRSNVRCYKRGADTKPQVVLSLAELINDFKLFKKDVQANGGLEYVTLLADYDYLNEVEESIVPEGFQRLKRQVSKLVQRKQFLEQKLFQLECKQKFSTPANFDAAKGARETLDDLDSFMSRYLTAPSLIDPLEIQKMLERCQRQSRNILAALD